jgi:hypothetical protein
MQLQPGAFFYVVLKRFFYYKIVDLTTNASFGCPASGKIVPGTFTVYSWLTKPCRPDRQGKRRRQDVFCTAVRDENHPESGFCGSKPGLSGNLFAGSSSEPDFLKRGDKIWDIQLIFSKAGPWSGMDVTP